LAIIIANDGLGLLAGYPAIVDSPERRRHWARRSSRVVPAWLAICSRLSVPMSTTAVHSAEDAEDDVMVSPPGRGRQPFPLSSMNRWREPVFHRAACESWLSGYLKMPSRCSRWSRRTA